MPRLLTPALTLLAFAALTGRAHAACTIGARLAASGPPVAYKKEQVASLTTAECASAATVYAEQYMGNNHAGDDFKALGSSPAWTEIADAEKKAGRPWHGPGEYALHARGFNVWELDFSGGGGAKWAAELECAAKKAAVTPNMVPAPGIAGMKIESYTCDAVDQRGDCAWKFRSDELSSCDEGKAAGPTAPPGGPPATGGSGGGGTKGQGCNILATCASGLTCKLVDGWSLCVVPVFGKCECQP